MFVWKKVSIVSSVLIAASAMGACSTTGSVKTSASNPAPISFKVGAPSEASRQMASLVPAAPRSYVTAPQPAAPAAPEYLAPLPQTIVPAAPTPERFDQSQIDTQLYMHQKVGRPYKIKGVQYKPKHNPSYDETGVASWYGPNFHGKLTANGETYDKHGMTAAHKTLPLNSMVFVTNMENGKTVKLRLNDRGPFVEGRIIDLSYGAAKVLGVEGLAKVRVQYAGPADPMNGPSKKAKAPALKPVEAAPFVAQKPAAQIRPRQTFNPPVDGGVMTMTITGPIHTEKKRKAPALRFFLLLFRRGVRVCTLRGVLPMEFKRGIFLPA